MKNRINFRITIPAENFRKGFNPGEFKPIRNLFPNQPKKHFKSSSMQIGWKLNWLNSIQWDGSNRMDPNSVFNLNKTEWIRTRADLNRILNTNRSKWFRFEIWFRSTQVRIHLVRFGLKTWFGLIRLEVSNLVGLIFNRFALNKIQNVFLIGSKTDPGRDRVYPDWITIRNFYQEYPF